MLRVIPLYLSRSRPLSSDKEEQPGRGGECPGCGKGAGVSSEQTQPGAKVCHAGIYHVGHLSPWELPEQGRQEKLVKCWGCYSVTKALETPTSQLGVLWSSEVNSVKGDDLLFGVPNNLAAKQVMLEGWDKLGFPSRTVQMNRTSVLLQESWGEQSWEGGNASQVQWIPGVTNVRVSVAVLSIMVSQVASAVPQCHILNAVPLCCTWL